jgi:hypothetical protein
MDATRFDAISREVGTKSDRRGLLKTLAGSVFGLAGLAAASDVALGKQKCKQDRDCSGNKVCKNKKCVDCKSNGDCNGGKVCDNNKCVQCKSNKDCKSNERCKNNNCKKK